MFIYNPSDKTNRRGRGDHGESLRQTLPPRPSVLSAHSVFKKSLWHLVLIYNLLIKQNAEDAEIVENRRDKPCLRAPLCSPCTLCLKNLSEI